MPTTTIRKRLLCVEDFLSAVATGGAALEDFADKLAALADDVEHAIASSLLDEDTMSLAATIFLRVEILASSFQDILETTSSLEASMKGELEDTFARLSVDSDECETDPLLQHLPEGVSYWPSSGETIDIHVCAHFYPSTQFLFAHRREPHPRGRRRPL